MCWDEGRRLKLYCTTRYYVTTSSATAFSAPPTSAQRQTDRQNSLCLPAPDQLRGERRANEAAGLRGGGCKAEDAVNPKP